MLAPVGALETFDPGSAASVVRGAGRFGAAHMLSSVSEPGLENVAKAAPDAMRMYQLYVRGDDAFVEEHVSRAIASGYTAFCLTVDTAHYSRRERDIAKRYVRASRLRVSGGEFQMGLEWRTVKLIKDKYRIPLVIKGIATAEDAAIALDHGVEWIYVSNHGGRQLDHGRGAMQMLPEIVAAVAGRARIMVDGSFCRGTDIVKAIAAGADLVGIGRLQCWALAAAGEEGIVRMLELLEDEVIRCLGLLGVPNFAGLDQSYLHAAAPPLRPMSSVRSRCWTSSPIVIDARHLRNDPPLLSPGTADALLFDLGRVVIDIDFNKALACWAGHAGCEPSAHRRSASCATKSTGITRSARSRRRRVL